MWGDAVLKTLMAFETIFVLFNLHLSPSWGLCLWAGECCSAELPHPKQETQEKSPVQCSDGHGTKGLVPKGWLHNRTELRPSFPVLTQKKISQIFKIPKSFSWSSSSSEGLQGLCLCASFSMSKLDMVQPHFSSLTCRSKLGAARVPWVPWNRNCWRDTQGTTAGLLGAHSSPACTACHARLLRCFQQRLWVQHEDVCYLSFSNSALFLLQMQLFQLQVLHGTADATPGSSQCSCADRSRGWGWAVSAPWRLCVLIQKSMLLLTSPSTHSPTPRYQALFWLCAKISQCFVFN